jgi:hypothetical protein
MIERLRLRLATPTIGPPPIAPVPPNVDPLEPEDDPNPPAEDPELPLDPKLDPELPLELPKLDPELPPPNAELSLAPNPALFEAATPAASAASLAACEFAPPEPAPLEPDPDPPFELLPLVLALLLLPSVDDPSAAGAHPLFAPLELPKPPLPPVLAPNVPAPMLLPELLDDPPSALLFPPGVPPKLLALVLLLGLQFVFPPVPTCPKYTGRHACLPVIGSAYFFRRNLMLFVFIS